MWRLSEKRPLATYLGHTNWVRCARLSPDNKLVASCAEDKVLKIFDATSSQIIADFKDTKGFGNQIAWHHNSKFVAIAQENARVKLYDLRAQKLIQYYRVYDESVTSLDFHSSGNFIITGCKDGTVKILDLLEGRDIYTLSGHRGSVTSVKFSNDGEYFVTGSQDRHVRKNLNIFNHLKILQFPYFSFQIMVWKSNLISVPQDEDQENEPINSVVVKEEIKEEQQVKQRPSILIDARKSSIYKSDV